MLVVKVLSLKKLYEGFNQRPLVSTSRLPITSPTINTHKKGCWLACQETFYESENALTILLTCPTAARDSGLSSPDQLSRLYPYL